MTMRAGLAKSQSAARSTHSTLSNEIVLDRFDDGPTSTLSGPTRRAFSRIPFLSDTSLLWRRGAC